LKKKKKQIDFYDTFYSICQESVNRYFATRHVNVNHAHRPQKRIRRCVQRNTSLIKDMLQDTHPQMHTDQITLAEPMQKHFFMPLWSENPWRFHLKCEDIFLRSIPLLLRVFLPKAVLWIPCPNVTFLYTKAWISIKKV